MQIGEHDGAFPIARTPEIPIPHGGPLPVPSSSHDHNAATASVPPQGRRFQTRTTAPFPTPDVVGPPPFADLGGEPVYVGSAVFENPDSVHPCKLVPTIDPPCRVPYGGTEYGHHGR